MDWRPEFKVKVDGTDITSLLSPRLVSLSITDEAGVQSDAAEITITDTEPLARLEIPPTGAEVEIAIGYRNALKDLGLYVADSVEVQGPPDSMRIRATASPSDRSTGGIEALTQQKTRSWEAGTTISDLVATIAGENKLEPVVSDSLASIALPHQDQIDESDINLLTRVARDYDAIAKVGGGRLIFAEHGASLSASGELLPSINLQPSDVTSWSLRKSSAPVAGKVVAVYHDQQANQDVEVTAGDSQTIRRLRRRFPDQASAQAAADAEFRRSKRAGTQLSITLPGNPDLIAEGRIVLSGFRPGVNGEWLITRVQHRIGSGGYSSRVTAEVPD